MTDPLPHSARRILLLALLSCLPLATPAAEHPGATSARGTADPEVLMPSPLDAQVEKLKNQTIDIQHQAQSLILPAQYPDYSRVDVYFGVDVSGLIVDSVTISVDGDSARKFDFDRRTAINLIDHGLDSVGRVNVTPGEHRIYATVVGRYADAKVDDPPLRFSGDFSFRKSDSTDRLELDVFQTSFLSPPSLRLRQWVPNP